MKVHEICFSPTGGTQRVAAILTHTLADEVVTVDLTDRQLDFRAISLTEGDTALIAVPSYSGRVPASAAERIAAIRGNGARAILVCVYGNRAYEDTLVELCDMARSAGFEIVAAVAAIAEHSIARKYAKGRPDAADVSRLTMFATRITHKLDAGEQHEPVIPGNRPYRKISRVGIVPQATKRCVKCGLCAEKCPVGAIDMRDPTRVNKVACISCMRCVAICSHQGRKISPMLLTIVNLMLKKVCSGRKECELYL